MMIESIVFYILAVVILIAAFCVVTRPNLLHAALSLMVVLVGVAGLYVLLSADFLAAVQVILYVGGVLVLIIFAVMLSEKLADRQVRAVNEQKGIALVVTLVLLMLVIKGLTGGVYKLHSPRDTVAEVASEISVSIQEQHGKLKIDIRDTLEAPPQAAPLSQGKIGTTAQVGLALMTDYVLPFEVASLLLLAAMIGAILFTRREDSGVSIDERQTTNDE